MKTAYAIGIAIVIVLAIAVAAFVGLPYLQPSQTTSGTNTSNGQLAMMATDPPITASGVSAASIMYAGAAAHTSGSSSDSGWVQVAGSGSLDLMANAQAQTIASSNVAAGTYDKVRFDVTSASVTYNGKQYPCAVASGTLTTNLESNVQVNAAAKAAALVDVRTFIINSANSSNPQFVFTATAKATAAPSSVATSSNLQVGSKVDVQGQAWFTAFRDQTDTHLTVSSSAISSGSMQLTVRNTGNAAAQVQTIIITPVSIAGSASGSLPASLTGSAVFTVDGSGSLTVSNTLQAAAIVQGGAQVTSNADLTLTFTGAISLNLGLGSIQLSVITPGQSYLVTVIGANTFAGTTVVAH